MDGSAPTIRLEPTVLITGGSVKQGDPDDPTKRKRRFVGPEEARSRALRSILAGLWKFVRRKPIAADLEGDLSLWICRMHGIHLPPRASESGVTVPSSAEIEFLTTFGSKLDPEEIIKIAQRGEAVERSAQYQRAVEAGRGNDVEKFQNEMKELIASALEPWRPVMPPQDLSIRGFYELRRALRATLWP